MKQSVSSGGGGGGRWRIPKEDEVEVLEILLTLGKLFAKSELLSQYTFTWGRKKKRSVLVSKSKSSQPTLRQNYESRPEKVTAAEADKSPSTPLCFLPSGSGSDDADKPKQQSSSKRNSKKKATDDLIETYNGMQQQKEILRRKIKAMENLHQELKAENLELKAKRQEFQINYSRNIEDFQVWNNSMKMNLDQQIAMFAPPPPPQQQQQQQCQQFMAMSCSSNSNNGGRFGLFNQIDPRVKIHRETFDFMSSSQPLDQSQYLVMDNDLRVRTAAAARRRRIMRMKENKNSLLALKLSKMCR